MLRANNDSHQSSFASLVAVLALGSAAAVAGPAETSGTDEDGLDYVVITASQVRLPGEYAGGQVARGGRAGLLGNLDFMETPFSSVNYTADLIQNQLAEGVADVLLNDPVVRAARGFGNFQELYIIRGFPTFSDDMTYNGIYGILPRQFVAAEFLERVEVFRGANAFLNGAAPGGSSLGGLVNLVPKRAPREPLNRVALGWENDSAFNLGIDIGRRFGADAATGVRFNAARRDGETSIENQDRELTVLGFGIDHDGDRLQLSADVGFQDHHIDAPRPSVTPPAGAIPQPPSAAGNFAFDWTYTDERQIFGVVRAEYEFSDNTTGWAALGVRNGEEENVLANPNALANGDTSAFRFDNTREDNIFSGDIGVRTEFDAGSVQHRLIVSASLFSIESKNAFDFYFATADSNLYNPIARPPTTGGFIFSGGLLANPLKTFTTDTKSIAIADVMTFADGKYQLTLGARHQNIDNESFDFNTGASNSKYDEGRVTPSAGFLYKHSDKLALYANYIEGLAAGEVAPAVANGSPVTNAGEVFKPYQTEQVELGVKYDSGSLGLTAAIFELSKPFGLLEGQTFSVGGEQRHRGVELSAFGELRSNIRILGGLTWLDAEFTRTQSGLNQGKSPVGVPDMQFNMSVDWDMTSVPGLSFDARVVHTSDQFADAVNTVEVSSWNRFDLGARYATEIGGKPTVFRARINNVTNENDWVSVGGFPGSNYLVLGDPRTFGLSVSVDF